MTWLRAQHDVPAFPDVSALHTAVTNDLGSGPVDYLEFGVCAGATILGWANLNANENSRFIGFDSFEGLPEAWGKDAPKGTFDVGGRTPVTADPRVSFVKGWFQDTVPGFLETFTPRTQLVVHIDCDLFSSTAYVLAKVDHLMKPGTIIIFDEYSSVLHEFRAWTDHQKAFRRSSRCIAVTTQYAQRVAFVLT